MESKTAPYFEQGKVAGQPAAPVEKTVRFVVYESRKRPQNQAQARSRARQSATRTELSRNDTPTIYTRPRWLPRFVITFTTLVLFAWMLALVVLP